MIFFGDKNSEMATFSKLIMEMDRNTLGENEIIIKPMEGFIQVHSNGNKDIQFATRLWSKIAANCRSMNCFNVLGIAYTTSPPEAIEAYQYGDLFEKLGIDKNYRIAWVELNPLTYNTSYFVETVLLNRDLNVRLFHNIEQAQNWLLQGGHQY